MVKNSKQASFNRIFSHTYDPTFDIFVINTQEQGDFSRFLQLSNFTEIEILEDEIGFFSELIKYLGNDHIKITETEEIAEITIDNVFSLLKKHEKHTTFSNIQKVKEIDFISSHFHEIYDSHEEEFQDLKSDTITSILCNKKLVLKNEDQLLKFVNKLYSIDKKYSILYDEVIFTNVSSNMMNEFVSIFDNNDMSRIIWLKETKRKYTEKSQNKKDEVIIPFTENNEFNGIINYLSNKYNKKIENIINVTSSSVYSSNQNDHQPRFAVLFDEKNKSFHSNNIKNSWICIDFKKNRINPTCYTVKSSHKFVNNPKSWVIEGLNENFNWEIIAEENNNSELKEINSVYTFQMNKGISKEFRYIRMRSTGVDWGNSNFLFVNSIEFYGILNSLFFLLNLINTYI